MPTTLVLVRHGETDWNRENRFQGHADIPLNEAGRAQARDLALELEDASFQAVYSSPLLRAYETATILAERLELEVERADDLMEVDVGSWSGLTRVEVEARFPQGFGAGSTTATAGTMARRTTSWAPASYLACNGSPQLIRRRGSSR